MTECNGDLGIWNGIADCLSEFYKVFNGIIASFVAPDIYAGRNLYLIYSYDNAKAKISTLHFLL